MKIIAKTYGGQEITIGGVIGTKIFMERKGYSPEECLAIDQYEAGKERLDIAIKIREYYWDVVKISGITVRHFQALKTLTNCLINAAKPKEVNAE